MNAKWTRALVLCAVLAACGGGGGGRPGSGNQAAYELVPQICAGDSSGWTSVVIDLARFTDYCSAGIDRMVCPPPAGEELVQIIVGKIGSPGSLTRVDTGTYWLPGDASVDLYARDETSSCVWRQATSGSVTLHSVTGGYAGSYDVVIDGKQVTGSFAALSCYSGLDTSERSDCQAL